MAAQKDFATIEVLAEEVDGDDIHDERPVQRRTIMVSVVLVVVILMLALAGGFWMGRQQGLELASSQDKARLQALIQKQQEELKHLRQLAKKKSQVKAPTTQVGELTFYNDLPNQGVNPTALHAGAVVPPTPKPHRNIRDIQDVIQQETLNIKAKQAVLAPQPQAAVPKLPATVVMPTHDAYQIQVASFQVEREAMRFSEKLKKHGFETHIQKIDLPRLGVWYRVYTGHYTSREQAKGDMKKLSDALHVTGLVVRL